MKIAVLSDIHANWPALKSVVNDLSDDIDGYIFVGDFIGILGYPSEVVSFAMENSIMSVKGNHDIAVLENHKGHVNSQELSEFEYEITHNNLSDKQKNWVSDLSTYELNPNLGIEMAHAKPTPELSSGLEPRNPGLEKGLYTKVASNIDDSKYDFIITGHTHTQQGLDISKFGHDIVVLNPGTVGSPGNIGVAEYAVIDTAKRTYTLETVNYDENEVIDPLKDIGVPVEWWK